MHLYKGPYLHLDRVCKFHVCDHNHAHDHPRVRVCVYDCDNVADTLNAMDNVNRIEYVNAYADEADNAIDVPFWNKNAEGSGNAQKQETP